MAQTHYTGGAPTAPGEDRTAKVVAWLEVDVQWSSRPAVHVVPKFHTLVDRRLEWAWDQPCLVSHDMWGRRLHVHIVTCHISLFDVHSVYNCYEGTAPPSSLKNSWFTDAFWCACALQKFMAGNSLVWGKCLELWTHRRLKGMLIQYDNTKCVVMPAFFQTLRTHHSGSQTSAF